MTWFDFCAEHKIVLTPQQVWSMHWLTMRGKRFLVDFGYLNAEKLADADVRAHYGLIVQ